jgi:hypothetical protein
MIYEYSIGRYLVLLRPRPRTQLLSRGGGGQPEAALFGCLSTSKSSSVSRKLVVLSPSSFGDCGCSQGDVLAPVHHGDTVGRLPTEHHDLYLDVTRGSHIITTSVFIVLEVCLSSLGVPQAFHSGLSGSGSQESQKGPQDPTK